MGRNLTYELVICSGAKECDTPNCKHKFTHYTSHIKEGCDKYSCSDMCEEGIDCYCIPWKNGCPDQWKYNEDEEEYIYTTGEQF